MHNLAINADGYEQSFRQQGAGTAVYNNMKHFGEVNAGYRRYFSQPLPTRTSIGVTGLVGGPDVGINMIT